MAKLKVEQFVDLVKRSGLVDDERLNQALSGVDDSVKDSGIIASNLTKAGLLTEWQSEKLLQGRHKGFYLGKYKLLNHIGTGGMGTVYLAEHQVMRHRVAIKLLPSHLAAHSPPERPPATPVMGSPRGSRLNLPASSSSRASSFFTICGSAPF